MVIGGWVICMVLMIMVVMSAGGAGGHGGWCDGSGGMVVLRVMVL